MDREKISSIPFCENVVNRAAILQLCQYRAILQMILRNFPPRDSWRSASHDAGHTTFIDKNFLTWDNVI